MIKIINVIKELPFKSSNGVRKLSDILYLVVHHDAHLTGDIYNAVSRYVAQADYHIKKGWNHLSYHIRVARDGKIYQTLPYEEIGYHAGNLKYNKLGIGLCLDGDFSKQEPTAEQLKSLGLLFTYFDIETPLMPKLTRLGFFSHKEVRESPTFCPSPKIDVLVKAERKRKS